MSFKVNAKKQHLSIILLIFLPYIITAQIKDTFNFKATYRLNFKPTKTATDKQKENLFLFVGQYYTKFSSQGNYKKDSLIRNKQNNPKFTQLLKSLPKTKFKYTIVNKLNSPKLFFNQKIAKDNFIYEENISPKWKMSSESKTLAGYKCQKAEMHYAGRDYTAWFTPEIPISAGPYKFSGLPGLIVEIYDSKKEYHFTLIGFKEIKKPLPFNYSKSNSLETEKEKFLEVLRKFNENPFKSLEQSGITVSFDDDSRKKKMLKKHREKQRNKNPIELRPTF